MCSNENIEKFDIKIQQEHVFTLDNLQHMLSTIFIGTIDSVEGRSNENN